MWARLVNAALGIWLMASPAVLGYGDMAGKNDHITGPLVATFAIVACWEVTRGLRWVNLVLGIWLLAAPWILGYGQWNAVLNDSLCGLLIGLLSFVPGRRTNRYGGGWAELWR